MSTSTVPTADVYHRRLLDLPHKGPEDRQWITSALDIYTEMLRNRVPFAQAAYRDAEFPWMLGDTSIGHPNGESYSPELGSQLRHTLMEPAGQWCVCFSAQNPRRAAADAWLREHKPPVEWIPDRPFGRASEQGMLRPFFEALRDKVVVLVGPEHYRRIPHRRMFGGRIHVPVPGDGQAWKAADMLADRIVTLSTYCDTFLLACGSAAALTIHRAWPLVKERATLIDIGATLDPYCGVFSRNRTKDPRWQRDVMPGNLLP